MPERDIRKELKKRVEAYGGEIRAVSWIGRRNAPDILCLFHAGSFYVNWRNVVVDGFARSVWETPAHMHPFIEAKAPGGNPTAAQLREHGRMIRAGCVVLVISTFEQLDAWLPPL